MAYSRTVDDHTSQVLVKYTCGHTGTVYSPGPGDPTGLLRGKVTGKDTQVTESEIIGFANWIIPCPECAKK